MTISDANSIPVVWSSMRSKAARENPRNPQWKSRTGHLKNRRPMRESTGLPMCLFFQGIAPAAIPPRKRLPITRSTPTRSCSTNGSSRLKS